MKNLIVVFCIVIVLVYHSAATASVIVLIDVCRRRSGYFKGVVKKFLRYFVRKPFSLHRGLFVNIRKLTINF